MVWRHAAYHKRNVGRTRLPRLVRLLGCEGHFFEEISRDTDSDEEVRGECGEVREEFTNATPRESRE